MENYSEVPNIITGKDLDYLCDMFNWNYEGYKNTVDASNNVTDEEIKDKLSDIYDIDGTLEEKIKQLKILTGKTLQGDIIETPEQIKTKYEAYGKFYDYFKKGDFKGEFSAEQLNEMMQYDDLKPYIADAFNGDSSGLQNAIEKYRQNVQ